MLETKEGLLTQRLTNRVLRGIGGHPFARDGIRDPSSHCVQEGELEPVQKALSSPIWALSDFLYRQTWRRRCLSEAVTKR